MAYLKRTADAVLVERLEAFGAILIEGPKWCGKTTTAEHYGNFLLYVTQKLGVQPFAARRPFAAD
jgi:hypothetical protein